MGKNNGLQLLEWVKLMDKEQKAIERIKLASQLSLQKYGKPLICTYSGGKDSDVLLELFKRSNVGAIRPAHKMEK